MSTDETHTALLTRIADALERLAPPAPKKTDLTRHEGYIWETEKQAFRPVDEINRLPLDSLQGIDQQKALLLENTTKFADQCLVSCQEACGQIMLCYGGREVQESHLC